MLNKNEIKGKGKRIEGAIKVTVGKLTRNPKLEAEGEAERMAGRMQETAGKALRIAGEAVEKASRTMSEKR